MTVIVGCTGAAASWRQAACAQMLQAQRLFAASDPIVAGSGGATFGAAQFQPQDSFERQPLDADRFLLVADARLSNRSDLIRELGQANPKVSDSAIVLAAWSRWQERCLEKLAGDFAIAVWDKAERRLTLARDPTGQRPLLYAVRGDLVAFSTMAAGLLAIPELRKGFNRRRLCSMLTSLESDSDDTYFAGVSRVRPACATSFSDGSVSTWRHWWPPQDELRLSDQEFAEAYHEYLETAVRAAVPRSGTFGAHLSSGLDSSAVAATAARLAAGGRPIAFTSAPRLGFDGPVPRNRSADESGLATLTAGKLGLEHVVVRDASPILEGARRQCRLYEEPRCDIANMTWARAVSAEARARGVTALLTAEMGNLTLHAGGLPALAELVRQGRWTSWLSNARAAARSQDANWKGVFYNSFGHHLPTGLRQSLHRTFLRSPSEDDLSFVRKEYRTARQVPSPVDRYSGRYGPRFELVAAYDIGKFRMGALAEFGIDERDPTADRRLLDFSFRLPPEQLLDNGTWRPLARRALSDVLPPEILSSRLRGYQAADWYERLTQADARNLLEQVASSREASEILDLDKLRSAIDRWPANGWAQARTIALYRVRLPIALLTGIFLQEFAGSASPPAAS